MFGYKQRTQKLKIILLTLVCLLTLGQRNAEADFAFGTPVKLGSKITAEAVVTADGLELYFGYRGPEARGMSDIYMSSRPGKDNPWGEAVSVGPPVNGSGFDGYPSISADGLALYFTSTRSGPWHLWVTTRATRDGAWSTPVNLGDAVNKPGGAFAPCIAADGLSLFFASDRSGGFGGEDVWVTTRASLDDPWNAPMNLGPTVNSANNEAFPSISADGRVLFFCDHMAVFRPGGQGGQDIWYSTRATPGDPWEEPMNLGPMVNGPAWDFRPTITPDGLSLYFASDRDGSGIINGGPVNTWQVAVDPVVDFNGDYQVDIEDLLTLIKYWGQNESLFDIGPTPFGDGVVDAADLEVLMRHWGQDDSFIAHWKLDETGRDIAYDSVNENHAAVIGDPTWQRETGQIDGALELDGVDDYLAAPFILDPVKQPFSAFAWIKGGQPGQSIISQQGGFGAWLSVDSTGALATGLTFPMPAVTSDVVVTDDQWHRVGLVSDGSGMSLYVDDVEVAKTPTSPILPANGDLQIGAGKNLESGSFWSGMIDDVRIHDRVVVP
jgi:hypothetical protein